MPKIRHACPEYCEYPPLRPRPSTPMDPARLLSATWRVRPRHIHTRLAPPTPIRFTNLAAVLGEYPCAANHPERPAQHARCRGTHCNPPTPNHVRTGRAVRRLLRRDPHLQTLNPCLLRDYDMGLFRHSEPQLHHDMCDHRGSRHSPESGMRVAIPAARTGALQKPSSPTLADTFISVQSQSAVTADKRHDQPRIVACVAAHVAPVPAAKHTFGPGGGSRSGPSQA